MNWKDRPDAVVKLNSLFNEYKTTRDSRAEVFAKISCISKPMFGEDISGGALSKAYDRYILGRTRKRKKRTGSSSRISSVICEDLNLGPRQSLIVQVPAGSSPEYIMMLQNKLDAMYPNKTLVLEENNKLVKITV